MELNKIYNLDCREGLKQLEEIHPPPQKKKDFSAWGSDSPDNESLNF